MCNQSSRCGGWRAVAGGTFRLVADGPRQIERFAHRRIALPDHFFSVRIVPEPLNDVGFPVRGPVAWIHRIERRLLVRVLRMPLAEPQEILGRRIERHALRREFLLNSSAPPTRDLSCGVGAGGQTTLPIIT